MKKQTIELNKLDIQIIKYKIVNNSENIWFVGIL